MYIRWRGVIIAPFPKGSDGADTTLFVLWHNSRSSYLLLSCPNYILQVVLLGIIGASAGRWIMACRPIFRGS
jgi:hypothetical protein